MNDDGQPGRARDFHLPDEDALLDIARRVIVVIIQADLTPRDHVFTLRQTVEFVKVGVPSLYIKAGTNYIGKPAGFGLQQLDNYTAHDYHKVSDTVKPDWDFSGALEDLRLLLEVGWTVANGPERPAFKPGSEFKR